MRLTKVSPTASISPARLFAFLLALLLIPALAMACGGDDDSSDDAANGDSSQSEDGGGDDGADDMDSGDDAASDDMDDGSDAGDDMEGGDDAADDGAGGSGGGDTAGTITIGGESWTFVPSIQCGVFPGPVAYLAGHAAEDESVEITIDYDPDGDLVNAQVASPDAGFNWVAGDRTPENDLEFEVSGNTVTATGIFTNQVAGGESAEGTIDVTC